MRPCKASQLHVLVLEFRGLGFRVYESRSVLLRNHAGSLEFRVKLRVQEPFREVKVYLLSLFRANEHGNPKLV